MAITFTDWENYTENGSPGVLDWDNLPAFPRQELLLQALVDAIPERINALNKIGVSPGYTPSNDIPAGTFSEMGDVCAAIDNRINSILTVGSWNNFALPEDYPTIDGMSAADLINSIVDYIPSANFHENANLWALQRREMINKLIHVRADLPISAFQKDIYYTADIYDPVTAYNTAVAQFTAASWTGGSAPLAESFIAVQSVRVDRWNDGSDIQIYILRKDIYRIDPIAQSFYGKRCMIMRGQPWLFAGYPSADALYENNDSGIPDTTVGEHYLDAGEVDLSVTSLDPRDAYNAWSGTYVAPHPYFSPSSFRSKSYGYRVFVDSQYESVFIVKCDTANGFKFTNSVTT